MFLLHLVHLKEKSCKKINTMQHIHIYIIHRLTSIILSRIDLPRGQINMIRKKVSTGNQINLYI